MMIFNDQIQSCHAERSEESEALDLGFFAALSMTWGLSLS